jgi:hypothetical protein
MKPRPRGPIAVALAPLGATRRHPTDRGTRSAPPKHHRSSTTPRPPLAAALVNAQGSFRD